MLIHAQPLFFDLLFYFRFISRSLGYDLLVPNPRFYFCNARSRPLFSSSKSLRKMSNPCAAGIFKGVPPVQFFEFKIPNQDLRETALSFCDPLTAEGAIAAVGLPGKGVDAASVVTNCDSQKKSPKGAKDVFMIAAIKPGNCDTVATEYDSSSGGFTDSKTLKLTYQQKKGGPKGQDGGPGALNANFELTCKEGGPEKMDANAITVDVGPAGSDPIEWTFKGEWVGACQGHQFAGTGSDGSGSDSGDGGAFGIAVIVILLVGIVLYVGGMVGYNKFKLQKEGRELAPHPDFWTAVPGYLKDGHKFVFAKIQQATGKGGSSEYSSV